MAEEKIRAEQIYIADLFGDKYLFEVPDYQRPFVWETENFEQLFNDIKNEMIKNQAQGIKKIIDYEPYFLGSIVLYTKESKANDFGVYEIIDGRQRLVSLSILIAVIRDLAASIGNEKAQERMHAKIYQEEDEYEGTRESVRINVKENEQEFFMEFILTKGGTLKLENFDKKEANKKIKKMKQGSNESVSNMLDAISSFRGSFRDEQENI